MIDIVSITVHVFPYAYFRDLPPDFLWSFRHSYVTYSSKQLDFYKIT